MRPWLVGLTLSLATVPALAEAPEIQDPAAAIEVGRYGVMLDQAVQAEKLLVPTAVPVAVPDAPRDTLYEILVATVLRFNALSGRVCGEISLPAADCAGPFEPAWLRAEPADRPHLRAMIDETGERIGAFWGDVCAKVKAADEHLCDIE